MLLKKPIASVIIVLAVLIFGGIALSRLSIELLPEVTRPMLLVSTEYPGAPAVDVEYRINEPLEGVLASVRGVRSTRGIARQGQSLIFLTFDWGEDLDLAFLNVREKLDLARAFLPVQAKRPQLVYSVSSDEPIATVALTLKNTEAHDFDSRLALKRWAEQVFTRRLEQQEGIAQALLVGEAEPEVQIKYDAKLTDRYGLSLQKVQQVIRDANVFSSSGELRDGWYRYALKIQSRIESLDDIKNIPVVSLANGRVLLLSEIADIEIDEADPVSFALLNNKEVLNVLVKKEYGANTVSVFKALEENLAQIRSQNPDIEISVIREDASYIENSISDLLQTLIIGGILAFIVLYLFLDDILSPFTISISIPVSIFLTFVFMYLFDIQLNIISLSGLTLGIGLLFDNSIVVLENINRHKNLGLDRFEAARKGTGEIALAITASTFTTVSVFLPLIFLGGFEGAFFRDLAATLTISLLTSLLVAIYILPVFVIRLSGKKTRFLTKMAEGMSKTIRRYEHGLMRLARTPAAAALIILSLLAAAGLAFATIDKSALPDTEPEHLEYLVTLPGNTALRSAKAGAANLTDFIKKEMPAANVLAIGGYTDNTSLKSIQKEGLNKFTVSIPVHNKAEINHLERVFEALAGAYPAWTFTPQQGSGFGDMADDDEAPVQFGVAGTDRALSKRVGAAFEQYLAEDFDGVTLSEKYPQTVNAYRLSFKPDQLLYYEISEQELILYLESLTMGSPVTDWNRQDEQISIRLMGRNRALIHPEEINLDIKNKVIPLVELADIEVVQEAEQLERMGQSPVLTFNSTLSFTDWWWNAGLIRDKVNSFMQQTGYEIRIGGSAPGLIHLLEELGTLLLISVILIYLIMAVQYENLKDPLIIILAIPFAWIGSLLALFIGGVGLNALSFMGILILTGIAVNDAILIVEFMRRYYEETGNLAEAVRQAGRNRFRPVVMTTITTILGLVPMLIPFGSGYELRQSLALSLMGGMITSTMLTLFIIPVVFKWTESRKNKKETVNTEGLPL